MRNRSLSIALGLGVLVFVLALYQLNSQGDRSRGTRRGSGAPTAVALDRSKRPEDAVNPMVGARKPLWANVRVLDERGNPLPAATVRINCLGTQLIEPQERTTGGDGLVRIEVPQPSEYGVTVHAKDREAKLAFAHFPGTFEVRIGSGSNLTIVPVGDLSEWRDQYVYVQNRSGIILPVAVTEQETSGGSWGPGVVSIWLRGAPSRVLAHVAMPERGNVRVPIRLPNRAVGVRVRVTDGDGLVQNDWSARVVVLPVGAHAEWTAVRRTSTSEGGVFELALRAIYLLLAVDVPGAARTFAYLDPAKMGSDVQEVTVVRGSMVSVAAPVGTTLRSARAYYMRPFDPESVTKARRVRFIPRTLLGGNGGPMFDMGRARRRYPRTALVAEHAGTDRNVVLLDSLPPQTILWVEAESTNGARAGKAIVTGEPGSTVRAQLDWKSRCTVQVRIENPTGERLPRLQSRVDEVLNGAPQGQMTGVTDDRGRLFLTGLNPAARYTLTLTDGRTTREAVIPENLTGAGEARWTYVFRPGGTRSVRVHVAWPNGKPAQSILVSLSIVNSNTITCMTGSDGWAAADVPQHVRIIAIANRPHDSTLNVSRELGTDDEVALVLPNNGIDVTATLEMVRGPGLVTVRVWRGGRDVAKRTVFVDGRGVVSFRRIEPGTYRIEAVAGESKSAFDVTVTDGARGHVHLRVGE